MFYEAFAEEADSLRRHLPAGCQAGFTPATVQATGARHPPARLISIRTQSAIPPAWWPHLDGILARTTGYDHLHAYARSASRIKLACLPEYCSRAVAEQAALLWMALLRKLPAQWAQWSTFNRDGLTGGECQGRTLVVVGVGRIGHEVARIGLGLGMTVFGVDPEHRHADIDYLDWAAAAARADVVAACMDLNPSSHQFFRQANLAVLKPGCLLVNVARGELVDTRDVAQALNQGQLAGLAMDVFSDETTVADALRGLGPPTGEVARLEALVRHPRVLFTPHNAFNTEEAVELKSRFSAEQVQHFLARGVFRWPWNG